MSDVWDVELPVPLHVREYKSDKKGVFVGWVLVGIQVDVRTLCLLARVSRGHWYNSKRAHLAFVTRHLTNGTTFVGIPPTLQCIPLIETRRTLWQFHLRGKLMDKIQSREMHHMEVAGVCASFKRLRLTDGPGPVCVPIKRRKLTVGPGPLCN